MIDPDSGEPVPPLLDHDGVVAALQERLGGPWTITLRSARPDAPLLAMFSGSLQKAEPKEDAPPGETDYIWYVGTDTLTYGAFAIPQEAFSAAYWEATPKGPCLMVRCRNVLLALFPRAVEE